MPIPLQSAATTEVETIMAGLVAPAPHVDAPIIFGHVDDLRAVAQHLYDYGLRHSASDQRIWYHPPRDGASMLEASAGRWLDHPPGDDEESMDAGGVATLIAALTDEQRAELRAALEEA